MGADGDAGYVDTLHATIDPEAWNLSKAVDSFVVPETEQGSVTENESVLTNHHIFDSSCQHLVIFGTKVPSQIKRTL